MRRRRSIVLAALACVVLVIALPHVASSLGEEPADPAPDLVVRGGVGAIFAEQSPDLPPAHIEARAGNGAVIASGVTDRFGGLVLDESLLSSPAGEPLPAGYYQVVATNVAGNADERSFGPVRVLDESPSPGANWPYGSQDLIAQSEPVANPYPTPPPPTSTTAPTTTAVFDGVPDSQFRYGYMTTRDGTSLSYFLALPESCEVTTPSTTTSTSSTTTTSEPAPTTTTTSEPGSSTTSTSTTTTTRPLEGASACATGDVPTIFEYSMYDPSDPVNPLIPRNADDYLRRGYAVMAVNSRGTGCSGGAMRRSVLTMVEALDGYDVVETIAAQPWSNQRVGMTGESGPGATQWNVARTNPPHLKAITPAGTYARLAYPDYPGGIQNVWGSQLWGGVIMNMALPASLTPQQREDAAVAQGVNFTLLDAGWAPPAPSARLFVRDAEERWFGHRRINLEGDQICAANQRLRGQNLSVTGLLAAGADDADLLSAGPEDYADEIDVPTLIMQGVHDEGSGETATQIAALLPPNAATPTFDGPFHRMIVGNGDHEHPTQVAAFSAERDAFLDLFVAQRRSEDGPDEDPNLCADEEYRGEDVEDAEDVLNKVWEDEPVRVIGEVIEDLPTCEHRWELGLDQWPPATSEVDAVVLQTYQGNLLVRDEGGSGAPERVTNPDAAYQNVPVPLSFAGVVGGTTSAVAGHPQFNRPQTPPPTAYSATFDTMTLGEESLLVGPATVHLKADVIPPGGCTGPETAPVDFEVSLWEVTKEHRQLFVQSGWKRAVTTCSDGVETVETDVEIGAMTHLFREESGIRLTISAPGYTTPSWRLDSEDRAAEIRIDTTATNLEATEVKVGLLPYEPEDDEAEEGNVESDGPIDGPFDTYTPPGGSERPATHLLAQAWTSTIGAVTEFDVVQTDTDEVRLRWEAPESAPEGIDGYLVTEVVSGATRSDVELAAGEYSLEWGGFSSAPFFVVRAFSDSRVGEPVMSGVLYDRPTDLTATVIDTEPTPALSLSWTAPATIPTLALPFSYFVQLTGGTTPVAVPPTTATSLVVAGLEPSTPYDITVTTQTFFPSPPRATTTPTITRTTCPLLGCPP